AQAAAARTDSADSARRAAAARSCSCRQDIGPRHLRPYASALGLAQLGHLHRDEHLRASTRVRAAQRSDISVVPAVADLDISVGQPPAQRWVVCPPAAAPPLNPGGGLALDRV